MAAAPQLAERSGQFSDVAEFEHVKVVLDVRKVLNSKSLSPLRTAEEFLPCYGLRLA